MELSTAEVDDSNNTFSKNSDECDVDEYRSKNDGDGDGRDNTHLHDSEYTVDSLTNEPGTGTGWFGGIGTDLLHCLTDNVSPVVSGMATLVHKTAVAVANEISQLEREGELKAAAAAAERAKEDSSVARGDEREAESTVICPASSFDSNTRNKSETLILPWEICQESSHNATIRGEDGRIPVYFTDTELMKRIFALSRHDSTFLQPFSDNSTYVEESEKRSLSSYCSTFVMDEPRVKLIHRILDIDENLASVHARLTDVADVQNSSETYFWKNYFFHCERVRADEFCRRKKQNESIQAELKSSSETKSENLAISSSMDEKIKMKSAKNIEDSESLVPVGSDMEGEQDDDSSYVIQSAPNTGDTFATSKSIDDDLVLVDTHGRMARVEQL